MGINTFLNYRLFCPLCSCELESSLRYVDSKKSISYELDGEYVRWIKRIESSPINTEGRKYYNRYYRYSLYRENGFFDIDFLDNKEQPLDSISISSLEQCGKYLRRDTYFMPIQFVRSCLFCRRYQYVGERLTFNFEEAIIGNINKINNELFCLDRVQNKETKIYIIIVSDDETDIYADIKEQAFLDLSYFNDPLWRSRLTLHLSLPEKLEIQNTEAMMDRLDTLLFYS